MKKGYVRIICALILSYCNAFTQIPTDSLSAYYPFNGNANDSSGYGFHGTLNGQIAVTGQCAGAYKFSGNFISCGDPVGNEFDLVNNATISLWVKFYSAPPGGPFGGYFTLIGKDVGPGTYRKWFLATTNNQLVFHINTSISQVWAVQAVSTFALESFYHIVVTKTGNTYRFYVNGVYQGAQNVFFNIVDVPSPLRIGDLLDGSSPLNAAIDEVLIYRRVITQSEINQLYNCNPGVITATGTIPQDQPGDLKIFPNPSTGKFVLSFADLPTQIKNVTVYNLLGKKVFAHQPQFYNQDVMIDLGNPPKGVYLLQVQTRKKTMIRKIVVQ